MLLNNDANIITTSTITSKDILAKMYHILLNHSQNNPLILFKGDKKLTKQGYYKGLLTVVQKHINTQ